MTRPPTATHRDRLMCGLAEALRTTDYPAVTITDVVTHARTSKRTFYEHFVDKDACLVALLRDCVAEMVASIEAAVDPEAEWPVQARQAIEAMVASVEAQPAVHLTWLRVAPVPGPEGRSLSREGMSSFVALIESLAGTPSLQEAGVPPPNRQLAMVLVGGLRELIDSALEDGADLRGIIEVATEATVRLLGPGQS